MRNAGLEEAQAGIKTAGRNIHNLRYADNTTLDAALLSLSSHGLSSVFVPVLIILSYKEPVIWDLDSILRFSLNLNHLFKDPISRYSTFEVLCLELQHLDYLQAGNSLLMIKKVEQTCE